MFSDARFNLRRTLIDFPVSDLLLWSSLVVPWAYFVGFLFGYKALLGFKYKNSESYAGVIGFFSAMFICMFVIFLIQIFFSFSECLPVASLLDFCRCTTHHFFEDIVILAIPFIFSVFFSLVGAFLAILALYRFKK